jgi:hypothetical protein
MGHSRDYEPDWFKFWNGRKPYSEKRIQDIYLSHIKHKPSKPWEWYKFKRKPKLEIDFYKSFECIEHSLRCIYDSKNVYKDDFYPEWLAYSEVRGRIQLLRPKYKEK